MMEMILAQIDAMGGISANWVLVIITGVAGTLAYQQLREIKQTLKNVSDLVHLHDKEIAVLKAKQHEDKKEDE